MQVNIDTALQWVLTNGLRILLIIILAVIAIKLARFVSDRAFSISKKEPDPERLKRLNTLGAILRYVIVTSVVIIAIIMVMGEFGVEVGPVLAAAGVAGLAIGFGAQSLVQDVISGFFILLEDQIRVGDVVQIADKSGLVERVNLRMVVLRDLYGNVHYVRNGQIQTVTNMTKEFGYSVFDIGVAYREDIDEVIALIKQADEQVRSDSDVKDDILEPMEILGLDKFDTSAIIIKARIKTKPIRQWAVGREFNRRLKKIFDEQRIEIPFPHLTLYMGQDKQGQAAPLNVNLKSAGAADEQTV